MKHISAGIAMALAISVTSCTQKEEPKPMDHEMKNGMPADGQQMQSAPDTSNKDSMKEHEHSDMKDHSKAAASSDAKRQEIKSVTSEEKSVRKDEQPAATMEANTRDTASDRKVKKLSRPR